MKRGVLAMVLVAACGTDEPGTYDVSEINAALAGTWTVTMTSQAPIALGMQQASDEPEEVTGSCAAPPCISITEIELRVNVQDGYGQPVIGRLAIGGDMFRRADLYLTFGDKDVSAEIDNAGAVLSVHTQGVQLVHTP
jgi:hypothetical protein